MKKVFFLFFVLCGVHNSFPLEISRIPHLGKKFTVIKIPSAYNNLSLFLNDDKNSRPYRSFDTLKAKLQEDGQVLLFAMNGGMFHGDFTPVGLLIEKTKTIKPLNLKEGKGNFFLKPNGVLAWNEKEAWVLESATYKKQKIQATWATQSGPMLVVEGKIHPAFNYASSSRLIRNAVGLSVNKEIIFCLSEDPVNFHEIASLFKDRLSCRNALYLDGTVSSLYSSELGRNDRNYDLGPLVAITRKAHTP